MKRCDSFGYSSEIKFKFNATYVLQTGMFNCHKTILKWLQTRHRMNINLKQNPTKTKDRAWKIRTHSLSFSGVTLQSLIILSKVTLCFCLLMSVTGYLGLLTTQVMCEEYSQCYSDVNICLWTDGSQLSQSAAQSVCQQRNDSFLPRITNSNIQSTLSQFRSAAGNLLGGSGFWIDVKAVVDNIWHWIDSSSLAS